MRINRKNYESYLLDYLEGNLPNELLAEMELFLANNPEIADQLTDDPLPKLDSESIQLPDGMRLVQPLIWNENEVEELLLNSLEDQLKPNDLKRLAQFKTAFPDQYLKLEKLLSLTQILPSEQTLDLEFKEGLTQLDFSSDSAKLIAFTEGDLSSEEQLELQSKLKKNPQLEKDLGLFSAVKLTSDKHVFLSDEFKDKLKKEKKGILIPLWIKRGAVAAAVLFGMFLIPFSSNKEIAYQPRSEKEMLALTDSKDTWHLGGIRSAVIPLITDAKHDESIDSSTDIFLQAYADVKSSQVAPTKSTVDKNSQKEIPAQKIPVFELLEPKSQFLSSNLKEKLQEIDDGFITIDLKNSEWPESELAEENNSIEPQAAVSLTELAENKTKEKLKEEDEESLALAFVNSGAKKLLNSDEDLMAFEKEGKGFKFSIGKFSIEKIRTN